MKTNKSNLITRLFLLILIMLLFFIPTKVNADTTQNPQSGVKTGIIDPGNFEPPDLTDDDTKLITSKSATIVSVIQVIGIVVTVISLMVMGIKYMIGSIEEKADYKKTMIPYLIGVFIFFALTQVLAVVEKISEIFNA